MYRVFCSLALCLSLSCLAAGSALAGAEDEATDIPEPLVDIIGLEEWQNLVRGRTVTYRIGPDVWAYERYAWQGDGVAIQMSDGTCMTGTWYHQGDVFCFIWLANLTSCFQHVRADGQILVIPMEDGVTVGAVQTVAGVSDLVLTCGPTLSS